MERANGFSALMMLALVAVPTLVLADRSLESSIETSSAVVQLPSSDLGTALVRVCSGCDARPLTLTRETRYEAGGQNISLDRMRQLFGASNNYSLLITLAPGTTNVRRIVITSPVSLR